MNKKRLLTSFVAIGFAAPAMAEYQTVSTFPSTYMSKEKIYTNAATSTNTGKTSGTAVAGAFYGLVKGYYFAEGSYAAAACPANSYCPGTNGTLRGPNNLSAVGATACSTLTGSYSSSAGGTSATSERDCYKACTLDSATTTSLTSSSHLYYGGGDTCAPSACKTGYTKTSNGNGRAKWGVSSGACVIFQTSGSVTGTVEAVLSGNNVTDCFSTAGEDYGLDSGLNWAYEPGGAKYPVNNSGIVFGHFRCAGGAVGDISSSAPAAGTGNVCYCRVEGVKYVLDPATHTLSSLYAKPSPYLAVRDLGTNCSAQCSKNCARVFLAYENSGFASYLSDEQVKTVPSLSMCTPSRYKITYKCGRRPGGSSVGGNDVIGYAVYGSSYKTKERSVTNGIYCSMATTGWTLLGWDENIDATTPTYTAGQTISSWPASGDKTLYAIWSGADADIKFTTPDATSAGTLSGKKLAVTVGAALPTIPSYTMPTRRGYTLSGFYSNITGTETKFYNADKTAVSGVTWTQEAQDATVAAFTGTGIPSSDVYAKWNVNTITVVYSCGDGTGTKPSNGSATYGSAFTTAANNASSPCAKTGYTFKGWSDGKVRTTAGASYAAANWAAATAFTNNNTLTLTAAYDVNEITINWYGTASTATVNGTSMGTCSNENTANANCKTSKVNYGGNVITPSAGATINGQNFLGWKFIK